MKNKSFLTTNHWGTYRAIVVDGKVSEMRPFEMDPDPSPIAIGIIDALSAPSRITAPMVRESWFSNGPGSNTDRRGKDPFIKVSWEEVEKLVGTELTRVRGAYGSNSIYGGSYGWASAGRFHHAQSQLKRFLNCSGGFTNSSFTYSFAAAEAMIPHVLGSYREFLNTTTSWKAIAAQGELVVAFGGMPLKNGQIEAGGLGAHTQREGIQQAKKAGVEFVNISPMRQDVMDDINAHWVAVRPNSDVAMMLGIAHTLYTEKLYDDAFLQRYSVGFEKFTDYLMGIADGVVKDAAWASTLCEIPTQEIVALARKMARCQTMISVSWSLTRQDHGEQPFWMAITLAAMIGQIGKPGGGFAFGFSALNSVGGDYQLLSGGSLPQGKNGVSDFIPVSRIADMLLNPGATVQFNGQSITYPDIKLVWWAGGNPFHHHQDLNRLASAWNKPDTIICNEWCWNPLAKRSDIVLPCTTHLERDDISLTQRDPYIIRTQKAIEPEGEARNDYEIFCGISRAMGLEKEFSEGRSSAEWIRRIYEKTTVSDGKVGDLASTEIDKSNTAFPSLDLPLWDEFCKKGWLKIEVPKKPQIMLEKFINDPATNPLATPSGKIEIFSSTVASFDYDDCQGHPMWCEPYEWLGNANDDELHLISNQPKSKLHSQLDQGSVSRANKIRGREPVLFNSQDATKRGINAGDAVKIFNDRGACLGVATLSEDIRPGVIQISTGAWWDPDDNGMCRHGNPNVLTKDQGTSKLGQGPSAHTCLVKAERYGAKLPQTEAFNPPEIK